MKVQFPLLAKILLWLALNLAVLAIAFVVLFKAQFQLGLDSLLAGRAGEKLLSIGDALGQQLQENPASNWDTVLATFGAAYGMDFLLLRLDGSQIAGESSVIPEEVTAEIVRHRGPGEGLGRGPPPGRGPRREISTNRPRPRFVVKAGEPSRYWTGLWLWLDTADSVRPWPAVLVLRAESLAAGGLFVDYAAWAVAGLGAVLFSVVLWLPVVRRVTRSLSQMTAATEQIALGNFDVKVQEYRRDELGRLGRAINSMAERLSGFVKGQKRFLGDVAHELCTPVARIQVALGILEQRAGEKDRPFVDDLNSEVQHMSELINELLSFSKAGLAEKQIELKPVALDQLIEKVLAREIHAGVKVELRVEADLEVLADQSLLGRALGNLLRNCLRYAGEQQPVEIHARRDGGQAVIQVRDQGPGVPEPLLEQIFDPFFRAEASRSRETGGTGLGLTIVKACVEACQGTVKAANRLPRGLEVTIILALSPHPALTREAQ